MSGDAPALGKTIVLVGMMGAGKSAIGRHLAARLGVAFIDSDHAIEEAAQQTIPEIFERDGEAFFRQRESEVIERLLTGPPIVLATGGGAFLQERNRALIAAHGVSVWLKADLELLWSRVKHKTTRPLLLTDDPKATLAEIYEARVPIYALADLAVEAQPSYSQEDMTDRVLAALEAETGILETT